MKKLSYTLMLCFLAMSWNSDLFAQDSPEDAAMQKAWMESMTPGPEQAWLASMVGEWDTEMTMQMGPDQPAMESKGAAKIEMIMGGRYQRETYSGTNFGMPFNGESTLSHNNIDGKYYSTWLDNTGTGLMPGEGERDGNTLTMISTFPKLIGEGYDQFRMVTKVVNKDKHIASMYIVGDDGEESLNMEIIYTRKK